MDWNWGFEPLETFDAVVVSEGDEVYSMTAIGCSAGLDEALGNSGKSRGVGLLQGLNRTSNVLSELLLAVERGVHVRSQRSHRAPGSTCSVVVGSVTSFKFFCDAITCTRFYTCR